MCRFCARGPNVTTRRARARAGGGDMFLRMVSSFVVNLGCQTFEIQPMLYLGCQTFCIKGASNQRHFAGKFPISVVPLCH